MRGELRKIPIISRGQKNDIFKIELIFGTKARHLSPILGENYFFFSDHLILETKFKKWSKGVAIFEKFQKYAAIGKRLRNTGLDYALDERF